MRWHDLKNNHFKIEPGLIETISLRYGERRAPRSISPGFVLRGWCVEHYPCEGGK